MTVDAKAHTGTGQFSKTTMEKITKKIKIEISRENGQTYLTFEVDPKITDIFKNAGREIRESKSWPGLKFYTIEDLEENEAYRYLLNSYSLRDDYGSKLYANGKFNVAFIRTVGGKGRIKIDNTIPFSQVSEGIRNIVEFVKKYHEEYLKDYRVRGFVQFEV